MKSAIRALVVLSLATQAVEPLRDIKKLPSNKFEPKNLQTPIRVGTAKVVLADYDLIKQDFPALKNLSNSEIDDWLLQGAGYISRMQFLSGSKEGVNSTIERLPDSPALPKDRFIRPKEYDRALVFKVDGGLLDVKGAGSMWPQQGHHSNGLMTLGEGVREFIMEKLIQKVLEHSHSMRSTLGTYAVLDYGFDVIHPDKSRSPAGAVVRQAHERFDGRRQILSFNDANLQYANLPEKEALTLEKMFRRYGITSAGAHRLTDPVERINIQGSKSYDLIDFGGYLIENKFEKEAKHFFGEGSLITPKKNWVNPDPNYRIPFDLWGYSVSGKADPKADNLWIWSHELAENWRKGIAGRDAFDQHARNMLEPVDKILSEHPLPIPEPPSTLKARIKQIPACLTKEIERVLRMKPVF